jgi:hypothetical protein
MPRELHFALEKELFATADRICARANGADIKIN